MKYDVIVVGAGPAGSTTARICAENGLKTLILEKNSSPGLKACGGGLSPWLLAKNKIDKKLIERKIDGIKLYSNGFLAKKEPTIIKFASEAATTRRINFDKYLAKQAVRAGAELQMKTLVKKVSKGKVFAGNKKFSGEIIVGADGVNSVVARAMGFPVFKKDQIAIALSYEVLINKDEINERCKNFIELYFDKNLIKMGYAWIFYGKNFLNIGIGGRAADLNGSLKEKLDLFAKQKNIKGKIISCRGGVIPICGPIEKFFDEKKKMLLVGDAAGHTGPLLAEGIFYAVEAGKIAGTSIANYFEGFPIKNYQKIFNEKYGKSYLIEKIGSKILWLSADANILPLFFRILDFSPIKNKVMLEYMRMHAC